jgi:hypothetical protein
MRGGSRGGLTKILAGTVGNTIADMKAIQVASASGTEELLVVLVDDTFGVLDSGTVAYYSGAPTEAILVAGQQCVYAIADGGITKLDPKTGAVTALTKSAGTIPTGATLGAIYRDRLFLAGADNAVYCSAMGDYTNWDTSVDSSNTTRALPPFQLSGAAEVGDVPTALVPYADSHLLAATARGLWIIRGDPGAGGALDNISRHIGIIVPRAWCKVERQIVFLAEDGLYHISGDGSDLLPLSREKIPEELRDIDTSETAVLMGYDSDTRAVHIYLTPVSGVPDPTTVHWLLELEGGRFWPMSLNDDHVPVAVCEYGGQLILGGSDGYVRSVGGDDDDGEDISSHVLIGPFRVGSPTDYGLMQRLTGIIADDSGSVLWRLVPGDMAEKASANGKSAISAALVGNDYSQYVNASGAWGEGRSKTSWPRARAMWACLWLASTSAWSFESAVLETVPFGRFR